MTSDHPSTDASPVIESFTDYESLRHIDGYHEERDVVDEAVLDQMSDLPDLAGVGIVDPGGELLLRRQTDTCSWKIPVATVSPGDDFVTAIVDHVRATIGFEIDLEEIAGIWDITVETEDGERSASRGFVTFRASPSSGNYDLTAADPTGEPVHDSGWFSELPDDADEIPGTGTFLD